jgi:hypothetical protein
MSRISSNRRFFLNRCLASLLLMLSPVVVAQTELPSSATAMPLAGARQPKFLIADVRVSKTLAAC